MFQIDDIVLDQRVVFDLFEMENELPWHGDFLLDGQVNKMCHTLVTYRCFAFGFDGDLVGLVRLDRFFLNIHALLLAAIIQAQLLKG